MLEKQVQHIQTVIHRAASALTPPEDPSRREAIGRIARFATGSVLLASTLPQALLPPSVQAQVIGVESAGAQAQVVTKPIRYYRADQKDGNRRANRYLEEAWSIFGQIHASVTTGEDITPYIGRFLEPWGPVTDPAQGICNGSAQWRALQPRETPPGRAVDGISIAGEQIDALFASWFYQAAARVEQFGGRFYASEGYCGWGGERGEPVFWNDMLWENIANQRRPVVVEISTDEQQVWSYAIYKFSQTILRIADGTSQFDTIYYGNRLVDNTLETGSEKVLKNSFRINDQDPNYGGGFIRGTRINRMWVPNPRAVLVSKGESYQMENNAITPSMLNTMRLLFGFSDDEWAVLTQPAQLTYVNC